MHDEVLGQGRRVARIGFDRPRDAAVMADVAHLAMLGKMGGHELVAIKANPHHGHLRTAVRIKGHQVSQRW